MRMKAIFIVLVMSGLYAGKIFQSAEVPESIYFNLLDLIMIYRQVKKRGFHPKEGTK